MLETLKLVFGAVATKDIQPVLKHVFVYANRIQGGDGILTIDAPFACDLPHMAIPGEKFLNAVLACDGTPVLKLMESGRLQVKKGAFKASLSLLPTETFPLDTPRGGVFGLPLDFLDALKTLRPFISKDASRPWSMGIKFTKGAAYATNNVILARTDVSWTCDDLVLPSVCVNALLDLRRKPTSIQLEETSATFNYEDGVWLKTRVTTGNWPDVGAMIDRTYAEVPPLVHGGLLLAVQKVKRFCVNQKFPAVTLNADGVSSDDGGGDTASVEDLNLPNSVFNADMLELVLLHATHIDLSKHPAPCTFSGAGNLKGIFIGIKA